MLREGEIVEEGDYDTLMSKQGEFTRLAQIENEKLGIYIYICIY